VKYEKPTIHVVGKAQSLVLGTTKGEPDQPDGVDPFIVSLDAYQADE